MNTSWGRNKFGILFEHTVSHKEFQMLGHKEILLHCEKEPALSYQLLGIPTVLYTAFYIITGLCPSSALNINTSHNLSVV
jgi:hypothetical protein